MIKRKLKTIFKNAPGYLLRDKNRAIYHACIQKSASTWFTMLFSEPVFRETTRLVHFNPQENFIVDDRSVINKMLKIPHGCIVSPLYCHHQDFKAMTKPSQYKAFFVMRDLKDYIISEYFSLRYSHSAYHPFIIEKRKLYNEISVDEGIMDVINTEARLYAEVISNWVNSGDSNIFITKFEDMFGPDQNRHFKHLMQHLDIQINDNKIDQLLEQYSFMKMSKGRKQGSEDIHSHYRSGEIGGWRKYLKESHLQKLNESTNNLMIGIYD